MQHEKHLTFKVIELSKFLFFFKKKTKKMTRRVISGLHGQNLEPIAKRQSTTIRIKKVHFKLLDWLKIVFVNSFAEQLVFT